MSEDLRRPKRSKCINTWFTPINTQASNSSSQTSVPAPVIVEEPSEVPQSEKPPSDEPITHTHNQSIEFDPQCDFNAVVRDPADRCPIWKYPVNERDVVRRSYIALGPNRPSWKAKQYPLTVEGNQHRKFNPIWFSRFPWLEYSTKKNRAFCFPCFLFDREHSQNPSFTVDGYWNWKKAGVTKDNAFLTHVGSLNSPHNLAMQKWDTLRNPLKHINNAGVSKTAQDVLDNVLRLKASIESVRLLANQGQGFRGHDESESSSNAGNFQQVIKSYARVSDEVAKVVLTEAPGNAKYVAPDIQKQILNILGNKVRNKIIQEMGDDAKFCILVDEAIDTASKEQMSIILRYVDSKGKIRERFFKIVSVPNTTSLTLYTEICKVLGMFNLNVKNIRGQGYDGASSMSGIWHGLQALFLEDCPYAYYVHCFAHRLQLALCAGAKGVTSVCEFFSILGRVVNFVDSSGKRHCELKTARKEEIDGLVAIGELNTGKGANQVSTIQRAGATRWSSHFRSIKSMIVLFGAVRKTLDFMVTSGPVQHKGEAMGVLVAMRSFVFVFILLLMQKIMKITDNLCQTLQKQDIDILHAMEFVDNTKSLLQNMREVGWNSLIIDVESFCETHGIPMLDMSARYMDGTGRACQQKNVITNEHHYRIDIFNAIIDVQLTELNRRFTHESSEILMLSSTLHPHDNFKNFKTSEVCTLAEKFYPEDFGDGQLFSLEIECPFYEKNIRTDSQFQNLTSTSDLCQLLAETRKSELFPLIYRLICLVLTLPVSTATTERSFSSMNIIKNKFRNKMEDGFLDDCMVLHIESEFANAIDNDEVIREFEILGPRRVKFH